MALKKINFITGHDSIEVDNYYLSLTPGGKGVVGNYQFLFNQNLESYDYIVIFEQLSKVLETTISVNNIIFVAGEATSIKRYSKKFLRQFGHVITCQETIEHKSKFLKSPGHSWFSKKTYDELLHTTVVKKTKLLSIVVSNKAYTEGHRHRLEFCLKLKERLGDQVDFFGRGFKEFEDKWETIAPYKYSIAIENTVEEHWVTEKIGDCFTSHTFPFYVGAPNIGNYYNSKSFVLLDLNDFEASVDKILNITSDGEHYNNHLEYLVKAKHDYINKHSIIPMISLFIDRELKKDVSHSKSIVSKLIPEHRKTYKGRLIISGLIKKFKASIKTLFDQKHD